MGVDAAAMGEMPSDITPSDNASSIKSSIPSGTVPHRITVPNRPCLISI